MWLGLSLLWACTGKGGTEPTADGGASDGGASDGGVSDGGSTTVDTGGDGGGTSLGGGPCPDGMVPVPADDPIFCIDAYEGAIADGVVVSAAGLSPEVGITFDESVAACQATPVRDARGQEIGRKRLARLSEWQDAADGQPGEGGLAYPWGDTWVDRTCATPDLDGTLWLSETQLTGAIATCVSPLGAFDMVGNVWEWADPELTLDISAWLDARAGEGNLVMVSSDGALAVDSGVEAQLGVMMAGLVGNQVERAEDGALGVSGTRLQAGTSFTYRGYLSVSGGAPGELLPVRLDPTAVEGAKSFVGFQLRTEEDGAAIPAKVGCAWYTGSGNGCRNEVYTLEHTRDFDGTIGLRCAADPLPED